MTKVVGIIPARYTSSRFPGKPLIDIGGKTMLQRVYEQATKADALREVWIATDDERIFDTAKNFTDQIVMTSPTHTNGTSRVAEASTLIGADFDAVINIQGDEPFVQPSQLDLIANALFTAENQIVTLIKEITTTDLLTDTSAVKVVKNNAGFALYFSRNAIPFFRDRAVEDWLKNGKYYKHIGLYGFQKHILHEVVNLPPTAAEQMENLEQLRWLENGYAIKLLYTTAESQSIDTPADLDKIKEWL